MIKITPYLTFFGECEEAFEFYKTVFGGEYLYISRYKDMPTNDKFIVEKSKENMIMHLALPIGKETTLMGSDCIYPKKFNIVKGNNFSLSIELDSKKEADKIFKSLAKDGEIRMQMSEIFWGAYFGMLLDKFGIQWMINYNHN